MRVIALFCALLVLGLCQDEAQLVKRQSETYCWEKNKGYESADVLRKVPFNSVYECEKLCLQEEECIGASMTEENRTPKYCYLAKSGNLADKTLQFGATKECMKKSPMKPCSDTWNDCKSAKGLCTSTCRYWKMILGMLCRATCGLCDEKENEKEWEELADKKLIGTVINRKLTLEEAKKLCPSSGGISCNRGKKCTVVEEIKKEKKKNGFTAYKPAQ